MNYRKSTQTALAIGTALALAAAPQGGVTAQIWSLGHRNPLGIARDASGRVWVHERHSRSAGRHDRAR